MAVHDLHDREGRLRAYGFGFKIEACRRFS
jgi:hypothetical protein